MLAADVFKFRSIRFIISKMPVYAVAVGLKPGIYDTWKECANQVKSFKNAKYKKFATKEEAQVFMEQHGGSRKRSFSQVSKDSTDGPTSMECDGPQMVENLHRPGLYKLSKSSPSEGPLFELNNRLTAMESKLNEFMDKTLKLVGDLTTRIVKLEGRGSGNSLLDGPLTNVKVRSDSKEVDESFHLDSNGFVCVYTDGACSNNGQQGAKAGIGVWFNHYHPLNVSAAVKGPPTNNTAEIQAARVAITQAVTAGVKKLSIHTDSKFVIDCITKWIHKWKKNDWKLTSGGPVKNKIELIKLDNAIQSVDAVRWVHVRGHQGTLGNEMADSLARDGAQKYDTSIRYADHVDGEDVDGSESE